MTAVEWLVDQIFNDVDLKDSILKLAINQAKEMEKQKTIDFAYEIADHLACGVLNKKAIEDRYNEFFKSE
jgi:hypothetical protein